MPFPTENETWIIEEGNRIIGKKADAGFDSLSAWERLVYCLWVADYSMRNGGDLATAVDLYGDYKSAAIQAATDLSLPVAHELFCLSVEELEKQYLGRFEVVCDEIKRGQ